MAKVLKLLKFCLTWIHIPALAFTFMAYSLVSDRALTRIGNSLLELADAAETNMDFSAFWNQQQSSKTSATTTIPHHSITKNWRYYSQLNLEMELTANSPSQKDKVSNTNHFLDDGKIISPGLSRFLASRATPTKNVVFDQFLKQDLSFKYKRAFGESAHQAESYTPNQWSYVRYASGLEVVSDVDHAQKQVFGEYMVKYVSEYHFDKLIKTNPKFRPVYEMKQKISHLKVKIKDKYQAHLKYNFTGNTMTFNLDNPYKLGNSINFYMDPTKLGPSQIIEKSLTLSYPYSKITTLSTEIVDSSRRLSLAGSRRLGKGMALGMSLSTHLRAREPAVHDKLSLSFQWDI